MPALFKLLSNSAEDCVHKIETGVMDQDTACALFAKVGELVPFSTDLDPVERDAENRMISARIVEALNQITETHYETYEKAANHRAAMAMAMAKATSHMQSSFAKSQAADANFEPVNAKQEARLPPTSPPHPLPPLPMTSSWRRGRCSRSSTRRSSAR